VTKVSQQKGVDDARILLGLLASIERGGVHSQRRLAAELGIALGLVNAYLKRCVKKGLLKVRQAPARRYAYYLTPRGFSEKSRLTVEYLSYSFSFFRRAKLECATVLQSARTSGLDRLALAGVSDVAEIAIICALQSGAEIVGVVDPHSRLERFLDLPVFTSFDQIATNCDAVIITDIQTPRETYDAAVAKFGKERVFALAFLPVSVGGTQEVAA
jgi:DNA-binding MarR family transcriptional regulator